MRRRQSTITAAFLRAYTNAVGKELSYYSTSRGWFPVLFAKLAFRVGEVAVSHHERPGGEQSKHNPQVS
jgi:hypothetical protein